MRMSCLSAFALIAALCTATAQSADQWAGFYVGLTAANNTGDMTYGDDPEAVVGLKGYSSGVILG